MGTITDHLAEITKHGYLVLFSWVVVEQLGAPLPAAPVLIAAGVLSATGQLSLATTLLLGILACLIGDTAWYGIGKGRGSAVLRLLCKISLEPETCVRRGSDFISRHGNRTLLIAKFVPGVSTVAVPQVANSGTSIWSFFFYDFLGSALYVGAYLGFGRIVGDRIDKVSAATQSLRSISVGVALLAATAIVVRRYVQRRRFQQVMRTDRITPTELRDLIDLSQKPFVVDLRHSLDALSDPRIIPGAVRLNPDELSARHNEIPRDREIILYCS